MKKLLILLLVLSLAGVASATAVDIIDPAAGAVGSESNPLADGATLRVYIAVDLDGLQQFCATVDATGSGAAITGGILATEAPDYGATWNDFGTMVFKTAGGWQSGLSFDTVITGGTKAEFGLGHFGSTIFATSSPTVDPIPPAAGFLGGSGFANTAIAYFDVTGDGTGSSITLSMSNGSVQGDNTEDGSGVITGGFAGATIYTVPEPMTIALLGLGGLFLRRRK